MLSAKLFSQIESAYTHYCCNHQYMTVCCSIHSFCNKCTITTILVLQTSQPSLSCEAYSISAMLSHCYHTRILLLHGNRSHNYSSLYFRFNALFKSQRRPTSTWCTAMETQTHPLRIGSVTHDYYPLAKGYQPGLQPHIRSQPTYVSEVSLYICRQQHGTQVPAVYKHPCVCCQLF